MAGPDDLARFVDAQAAVYDTVRAELGAGRKATHWMWFIFPQLRGLGRSETARFYGLRDLDEARAYAAHPVLGPRLAECASLVLAHAGVPVAEIMGKVDALKLRSCATLFEAAAPGDGVYARLLETFYAGERCALTQQEIGGAS